MKILFSVVSAMLVFSITSTPCCAGNETVARQITLGAQELATGFEARRVLLTGSGLKIDGRNQAQPKWAAQITTDVIDLGGDALLSPAIDVRSIRASVQSNATGEDQVRVEIRTSSSYFRPSATWDASEQSQTRGRYVQLRIKLQSNRESFRISGATIDFRQVAGKEFDDSLRVVESHIQQMVSSTIPFGYQRSDHPDLKWLRNTFHLDSIIADKKTELEKVNALCTWVASRKNDRHDKWNTLSYYPWNVRRLMNENEGGTIYGHCASYCSVFLACCESLGWQGRHFAIEGYRRNSHETPEIYINELGRWIYFDPSLATYFADHKTGEPLDLLQMHDIYLDSHFNQPGDTVPKLEMNYDELTRRREAIDWNTFAGVPVTDDWIYGKKGEWHWQRAQGLMTTAWLQMTPRTNFYDQPKPAFREFGWGPEGSNGYPVWVDDRTPPRTSKTQNFFTRRRDFYWTLNQASLRLVRTDENTVIVQLGNNQPFFKQYRIEVDGKTHHQTADQFVWNLKSGANRLTVNCEDDSERLGVSSQVVLEWEPTKN